MESLPKTHAKAKSLGVKYYFTGLSCKRNHIDKRYTSDGSCVSCTSEKYKKNYNENSKAKIEYQKEYYEKNKEKVKNRINLYKKQNPEKVKDSKQKEYNKNKFEKVEA